MVHVWMKSDMAYSKELFPINLDSHVDIRNIKIPKFCWFRLPNISLIGMLVCK